MSAFLIKLRIHDVGRGAWLSADEFSDLAASVEHAAVIAA
jgi:hypothetical protein